MIYETTPDSNRGLRTIVVTHTKAHGTMLGEPPYSEKFQQVVQQVPAFAWDLLSEYIQQHPDKGQSDATHIVVS